MKIVIDARYIGLSGIGRFLECILDNLDFSQNEYTLIGKKKQIEKYNCRYLYDDNSPFSIKALFETNTKEINKADIYFTPNFIIPYGINTKVISTLHDIIFLDQPQVNKNGLETKLKKHLLKRCMKKSATIFTVSNFSKARISHYFPKFAKKICVHYPGVADKFKNYPLNPNKEEYLIYVGNIKKNKGIKTLLEAMKLIGKENQELKLYIVGDGSSLRNQDQEIANLCNTSNVKFTGKITDDELLGLLSKAKFLISPSHYEGFGATPLEALYLGCKPIISDILVYQEVYKDLDVIYFNDYDSKDLKEKILTGSSKVIFNKDEANLLFSYHDYAKLIESTFKKSV